MTDILRLRARRFHALHALLVGDTHAPRLTYQSVPEYLSQDLGLPVVTPRARPVSHLGILINHALP